MSTERRTLGEYIEALVAALDDRAARRLRHLARDRSAIIQLDDEAVTAAFAGERLIITPATDRAPPRGATDAETIVAILDGRIEAHDAILDGRIEIAGSHDDVSRIFGVIEILLDASPRTPELQQLAADFRRAHPPAAVSRNGWVSWYPFRPTFAEWRALTALDTLP